MKITDNELYIEDIKNVISEINDWSFIKNKTIFISGAVGMIGKFIVDLLMYRNIHFKDNCTVIANSRNENKLKERFREYLDDKNFKYYIKDINEKIELDCDIDFFIHAASNTHPLAYSQDPIGTITTNIIGTNNLLECARDNNAKKFVFLSTVEIYGKNRGDVDKFKEDYLGYIDSNTLRAGYPESKRAGEALCQAYIEKYNMDISVVRLPRVYGPTMLLSDSKAIAQFIKKAINKEDIVLKSEGTQDFSYLHVADAVTGIMTILKEGKCGEAYNLASEDSNITLRELAETIAEIAGTKVVFDIPSEEERKGYSTSNRAIMDSSKIEKELNWSAIYSIKKGIERTIRMIK